MYSVFYNNDNNYDICLQKKIFYLLGKRWTRILVDIFPIVAAYLAIRLHIYPIL